MRKIKVVLSSGKVITIKTLIQRDFENINYTILYNVFSNLKIISFSNFDFCLN